MVFFKNQNCWNSIGIYQSVLDSSLVTSGPAMEHLVATTPTQVTCLWGSLSLKHPL